MKSKTKPGFSKSQQHQPATYILEDWVDIVDVSNMLHLSKRTLARWRSRGLPYAKIGRKIFMHKGIVHQYIASKLEVSNH